MELVSDALEKYPVDAQILFRRTWHMEKIQGHSDLIYEETCVRKNLQIGKEARV